MKKNKIIGMLTSLLLVFSTFGSQIPVYAQEQTDTQEVNQNNGFTEDQGEVQEEQQESQEEGQLEITGDLTLSESQNTEEEVSVSLFNLVPQNLDSIYDGTAYFYILKPGETADSNRTPDEKWYGISTTGTVNLKYTPFQGQIICGKSHLVDTTYYDDHENGQHLNGVNIFIIVY